jgi:hypothetical protein
MKRLLLLISAVFLLAAGLAFAQSPGVPTLSLPSPSGEEQINVGGLGSRIETVKLVQARDAVGYLFINEAATNTPAALGDVSVVSFYGATAGTATIITDPTPADGQKLKIFSQAGVTALTLTASAGQSFYSTVSSLSANSGVEYVYQLSSATWYRTQ